MIVGVLKSQRLKTDERMKRKRKRKRKRKVEKKKELTGVLNSAVAELKLFLVSILLFVAERFRNLFVFALRLLVVLLFVLFREPLAALCGRFVVVSPAPLLCSQRHQPPPCISRLHSQRQ
jgi:predicted RND superfamily exporter protein